MEELNEVIPEENNLPNEQQNEKSLKDRVMTEKDMKQVSSKQKTEKIKLLEH